MEQHSEHPLGAAIVAYALDLGIEPESVSEFRNQPGRGALATIGDSAVAVGKLFTDAGAGSLRLETESAETSVYIARDDQLVGAIQLNDRVKSVPPTRLPY